MSLPFLGTAPVEIAHEYCSTTYQPEACTTMVSVEDRSKRFLESALKIQRPFQLDESLCLYSPQDNVDALAHPRIAEWLDFIQNDYEPELPEAERHVLLFMPCTKTKPYPFSSEHMAINQRLLDEGYRPSSRSYLPQELQARLNPPFSPEVLNLSPLIDDRGTVLHRMVISEPMAVVPYEHIAEFRGKASPAVAYDDPGLFENRGNAVSPWRADSTAVRMSPTRWKWGDEERRAYVVMHNAMAQILCQRRLAHRPLLLRRGFLGCSRVDPPKLRAGARRASLQPCSHVAKGRRQATGTGWRQRSSVPRTQDRLPSDARRLQDCDSASFASPQDRYSQGNGDLRTRRRQRDSARSAGVTGCAGQATRAQNHPSIKGTKADGRVATQD